MKPTRRLIAFLLLLTMLSASFVACNNKAAKDFYSSIQATEVTGDLYSLEIPWENFKGYFHFLIELYKPEVDATQNVGNHKYKWTWVLYAAPANENGNIESEEAFTMITPQIDTVYDFKNEYGEVLYRLQTGSLTKDWVVGQKYEVIVVLSNGDASYKCQLFPTWTQLSADHLAAWVTGLNGDGTTGETITDAGYEKHIPTTCPCEF